MTWRSTLKAKAHEYVVHHYSLSGHRFAEENLTNARELIYGANFVRDGFDQDVGSCSFPSRFTEIYFTGYDEEHGLSSTGRPSYRVFLHRNVSACNSFPGGVFRGGPKVGCVSCCDSSKYALYSTLNADLDWTVTSRH